MVEVAGEQGYAGALFQPIHGAFGRKGTAKDISLSYAYFKLSKVAPRKNVKEIAGTFSKPELKKQKNSFQMEAQPTALTLKAMRGVKRSRRTPQDRQEISET